MRSICIVFAFFIVSCGWRNDSVVIAGKQSVVGSKGVYSFVVEGIDGSSVPLSRYQGKVLLIVNVASKCGLTPQYKDLQQLYIRYRKEGLVVLGFPANNFFSQEPGSDKQIKQFCQLNYGVSFPLFSKISVKGKEIHPLYRYLTEKRVNGVLQAPVKWNFQKFLIARSGRLVAAIGPARKVLHRTVMALLQRELAKK